MSPSSNKSAGARALSTGRSIGIAVGRRRISAACIVANGKAPAIKWTRTVAAPEGWLAGRPSPEQLPALIDALARLVPESRETFVPVHVSLPDALAIAMVFELDELPKAESVRRRLVRWRIAQAVGTPESTLEVACQALGSAEGKHLVLGQAFHAGWIALLKDALSRAGIVPWSINQALCFRFNAYYPQLMAEGRSGAMLAQDPDCWTAAVWDASGRLRFARARWHSSDAPPSDGELEEITEEFERTVLAYVHAEAGRSVERIYISVSERDRGGLAAALNRRLHAPCTALVPDGLDHGGDRAGEAAELALVVAGSG